MPSPFPGMDPYIEVSGLWGDFHGSMVVAIRDELNLRLPPGYVATLEVYVWTSKPKTTKRSRQVDPDVHVWEHSSAEPSHSGVAAIAPPAISVLPSLIRHKRKAVSIREVRSHTMLSAVEILSPSNKAAGEDRDMYLAKRADYLANQINLVEIDFLRNGKRPPLGRPAIEIKDYCVMVSKNWEYPRIGIWTFSMREPIPGIPVPVTAEMPEIVLPLQTCFERSYSGARYEFTLPYGKPLVPRPRKEDAAWIQEILTHRAPK